MSTIYRNIQISNENITQIQESLKSYKMNFEKYCIRANEQLSDHIKNIFYEVNLFNEPNPIKLLKSNNSDYIALITHNALMNNQLALELSRALSCVCILAQFCNYEHYGILIFYCGKLVMTLIKSNNSKDIIEPDPEICHSVLKMDDDQIEHFKRALNMSDILDSYLELEYVLNVLLTLDFDHMSDKKIKEYEKSGDQWFFV